MNNRIILSQIFKQSKQCLLKFKHVLLEFECSDQKINIFSIYAMKPMGNLFGQSLKGCVDSGLEYLFKAHAKFAMNLTFYELYMTMGCLEFIQKNATLGCIVYSKPMKVDPGITRCDGKD